MKLFNDNRQRPFVCGYYIMKENMLAQFFENRSQFYCHDDVIFYDALT